MLYREQEIIEIAKDELVNRVQGMKEEGYRIVQINCTTGEKTELNYSFEKDNRLTTLRIVLSSMDEEIPSVSSVYLCAFLYENEIHDLFGITVKDMAIDYKGTLYQTAVKTPWKSAPEVKS